MKQITLSSPVASLALLLGVVSLPGCSNESKMAELQSYVETQMNLSPGVIEPPPQFVSYVAFTYSAASLRSPFEVPLDAATALRNKQSSKVKPDENRPKEQLENFAIGSLSMVGTLSRSGQIWALIKDDTNNITRVTVGNYLGKNHGRIVAISKTLIEVTEIVPTGDGGWIERPQTIQLAQ